MGVVKMADESVPTYYWKLLMLIDKVLKMTSINDEKKVNKILQLVSDWNDAKGRNISGEVKDFFFETKGYVSIGSLYRGLHTMTKQEKGAVRVAVSRLKKNGYVQQHPRKGELYRKVEDYCDLINWQDAPTEPLNIELPFGLHEVVNIYAGNIIVVAGIKGAGKSAFCLNTVKMNMDKHEIHYFSSEMGDSEFKIRLNKFEGAVEWKFFPWERASDFADVIKPDAVNIIDYLEVLEDFYSVGRMIFDIWEKLNKGIAIIALQKEFGRDYGRGKTFSVEKSRLYLAMDTGFIKIVDAKNWKGYSSPKGKVCYFKIINGAKFIQEGTWHYFGDDPRDALEKKKREEKYGKKF